ncbi:MmgE/PrpD family protein [Pseudonocardia spinosispora]|uniref:MmgE/PrpD family protein n=1 Tax=Pseudonocardia spinosispora TaxID=103441 RepID=UPI00041C9BF6|nr:MmgE/PrpD family protein [Pseudonocardia spinosispora]
MSTTDQLVDHVRTATPSTAALDRARDELARFRADAERGAERTLAPALRGVLGSGSTPPWRAWIAGTSAADAGCPAEWLAVCAAATSLDPDGQPDTAVALGYQVAAGTAAALGAGHSTAGWCVHSTAGAIGAVAAAGRLLGLEAPSLRAAFGICATQAAGITSAAGTPAGSVQLGKAAANAVEAALLARDGFTSSAQPLEGRRGMFALMSPAPDETALLAAIGLAQPVEQR